MGSLSNLLPRVEFLLQSLFVQQTRCPYCRSEDLEVVVKKYPTVPVKRCLQCALCFTSPIYRSCLTRNFYQTLYSPGEELLTRVPKPRELARMKENNFAGTHKDFNWLLPRMADVAGRDGPRLLEIGCSWGYFLFQAKRYGFDPVGIEIDARRASFGRERLGVKIETDFDQLPEGKFDVAFSCHVFEHLTDPALMLERIRSRLAPGGHLLIMLPIFDWDRFGKANLRIIGAVHPLGFNVEFFKRNLPRHGFSIQAFFAKATDFPDRPSDIPTETGLMVWARKES